MPKSMETEDSSDSNSSRLKICLGNYNKLYRANPTKRTARPIFSLLLLTFFAATFVSRTFFHRSIALMSSIELDSPISTPIQSPVVFNETLLRLASVDLSEEKTKLEVKQLLDGDMESIGRYRAFNTWRRLSHRDLRSRQRATASSASLLRSPSFYRHWITFRRALRDWWRNRRHEPNVISELVSLVRGSIEGSDSKYSSCAVIGNSGILLNSDYGSLIDGHEAVIRLNNARTQGHEKKVGSKTTISFVNSNILHLCARKQGCSCHPYGTEIPTVMYICQALHFLDYSACNATWHSRLVVTDPRFDVLCSRLVKYYSLKLFSDGGSSLDRWGREHDPSFFHYSSGMQAVVLALGVCERVDLFGFGKSGSAKHHYHTNQKAELRLHDYEAEYGLYRDLAERPEAVPFIPRSFVIPPVTVYL